VGGGRGRWGESDRELEKRAAEKGARANSESAVCLRTFRLVKFFAPSTVTKKTRSQAAA